MSANERRMQSCEFECPICAEAFVEPRQLPCGHVYCVECLERLVTVDDQPPRLACPVCRAQFAIPDRGDVRHLPVPILDADDSDDLDLSSFEIVCERDDEDDDDDAWHDVPDSTSADAQTDNAWVERNVDDVVNRNIGTSSTYGDDRPTGTGIQHDNDGSMNTPAELQDNEQENEVAVVRGMASVEGSVGAVTLHNDELYVALNNTQRIHVFHCDSLQFIRDLPVNGLGAQVYGLAVCSVTGRLYISDWDNDCVHSVPLVTDEDDVDDDDSTSWNVANQPAGLSLTADDPPNVLVACHGAGKIQEWSPDGVLVREIQLADESKLVWHAVQLSDAELVVSHEGSQHRVIVVSAHDGELLRSCGQVDAVQLQYPRSVVFDQREGRLLVADQCNNRIVVIDSDLTGARQLHVDVNDGLAWPYGLHVDHERRRLYVAEWNQGRIVRVDLP